MDTIVDFFKSLPSFALDQILHPPFKLDPTVENTLIGLSLLAASLAVMWVHNRRHR